MHRDLLAELMGLGIGLAGLILFAVIVDEVEGFQGSDELLGVDLAVADWVAAHIHGPLLTAGLVLAHVGSVLVVLPLVLAAAAWSWSRGRRLEAAALAIGALLLQLLVMVLKRAFDRERPDVGLVAESGFSFPSGHAAFGAYLAVVLIWFVLRHVGWGSRTVLLLSLAAVWAASQALGRVLIGVHYVSDVLAGLGVGFAVGGFGLALAPFGKRVVGWKEDLVAAYGSR